MPFSGCFAPTVGLVEEPGYALIYSLSGKGDVHNNTSCLEAILEYHLFTYLWTFVERGISKQENQFLFNEMQISGHLF